MQLAGITSSQKRSRTRASLTLTLSPSLLPCLALPCLAIHFNANNRREMEHETRPVCLVNVYLPSRLFFLIHSFPSSRFRPPPPPPNTEYTHTHKYTFDSAPGLTTLLHYMVPGIQIVILFLACIVHTITSPSFNTTRKRERERERCTQLVPHRYHPGHPDFTSEDSLISTVSPWESNVALQKTRPSSAYSYLLTLDVPRLCMLVARLSLHCPLKACTSQQRKQSSSWCATAQTATFSTPQDSTIPFHSFTYYTLIYIYIYLILCHGQPLGRKDSPHGQR